MGIERPVQSREPNRAVSSRAGFMRLRQPLDNLESNWAYMVMASLAWNLKAWFGLDALPEKGRWASKYKIEKRAVIEARTYEFKNVRQREGYPRPCPNYSAGQKNHLPPTRVESLAAGFSSRLRPVHDAYAMLK